MLSDITIPMMIPVMMTLAILVGLLVLNLVLQVANYVRTNSLEQRILKNQMNLHADLINFMDTSYEMSDANQFKQLSSSITLEDLIRLDLEEQMTEVHLEPTNEDLNEILEETISNGKS